MNPNDKYHYGVGTPSYPSPFSDCIDADGCAVIPESVGGIGDMGFYGCETLKTVVLHAGVEGIHERAFLNCPQLEAFRVAPDNKTFLAIDGVLFTRSGQLVRCPPARSGRCAVPDGVRYISAGAFRQCEHLTEVTFPESLLEIREYAFADCTGLTAVTFPAGLKTTGRRSFSWCENLTRAEVRGKETEVVNTTFQDCPNVTVYTPAGSRAERCALEYGIPCKSLGLSIRWIPGRAAMTEYMDDDGNAVIPEGVAEIDEKDLLYCDELKTVTIPASVTTIAGEAFLRCPNLTDIRVAEGNPFLAAADGVLYHSQVGLMLRCPRGKSGALRVPEGVRHIGERAACGCARLTEVDLPKSLRKIDAYAFEGCASLTRLTVRGRDTEIADTALKDSPLVTVYAPEGSTALQWAREHGVACQVLVRRLFGRD